MKIIHKKLCDDSCKCTEQYRIRWQMIHTSSIVCRCNHLLRNSIYGIINSCEEL